MSDRESYDARTEAARDLAADQERPRRHAGAIPLYLAAMAYAQSRPRDTAPHGDDPQPVDEPAAPAR